MISVTSSFTLLYLVKSHHFFHFIFLSVFGEKKVICGKRNYILLCHHQFIIAWNSSQLALDL